MFPHFTVGENVGLVPRLKGWPPQRITARVAELLDQVGLEPAAISRPLSAPAFRRTAAARRRGARPGGRTTVLLFDEPFGALDPVTRVELQDQFLDCATV